MVASQADDSYITVKAEGSAAHILASACEGAGGRPIGGRPVGGCPVGGCPVGGCPVGGCLVGAIAAPCIPESCSSIIFKTSTSASQLRVNELPSRSSPPGAPASQRGARDMKGAAAGVDGLTSLSGHPPAPGPRNRTARGREVQDLLLKSHLQVHFEL